jgi:glycosyltransferase involved in cell wall biosynthesis
MKIAFVYMPGRLERLPAIERGEAPTEFFYGAMELARAGHEVAHFELDAQPGRSAALWELPHRLRLMPPKTDGHTLRAAARLCPRLNAFDCVVATASKLAFALGLCALTGRLRPRLLAIQCGVLNLPQNRFQRALTARLLRGMSSMVFGDAERAPMLRTYALDPAVLTVNQFGVDTGFWSPGESPGPGNGVVSVGSDGLRDYATLVAAAPQLAAPVTLVTNHRMPDPLPPNLTVHRGTWREPALSDAGLRALYREARAVVVPLRPSFQPSGQSVTLQAMACGRAVVLTETEGLWSREMMRDGENVLLCRTGDAADLAARTSRLIAEPELAARLGAAARETVLKMARIEDFAARIAALAAS